MQKTILTIIFALLLALTSWAQKFTISGDLSVMTNKFDLPPAKANIVYIYMERLFEGYAYRIRREGREVRDKRKRQPPHLFETHGTTGNRS